MNSRLVRAVAALQIAGGALGLGLGAFHFEAMWEDSRLIAVSHVFVFSLTCAVGALLWLAHPAARLLSILIQSAQILTLVVSGWGFQFCAGFMAYAALASGNPVFLFGPSAGLIFASGLDPSQDLLGINFVPLLALVILIRSRASEGIAA